MSPVSFSFFQFGHQENVKLFMCNSRYFFIGVYKLQGLMAHSEDQAFHRARTDATAGLRAWWGMMRHGAWDPSGYCEDYGLYGAKKKQVGQG